MNKEELKSFVETHKENYSIQLKRHSPILYSEINASYSFNTFGQKMFHYLYGNDIGKCEMCGNLCKFDGIHKGYRKRCSYKCMGISKYENSHEFRKCVVCDKLFEVYKKREKTTCSEECLLKLNFCPITNKKRMDSLKRYMVKKYGVEHNSNIPGFGEKVKKTKMERYGNEKYVNPIKCKDTKYKRYGSTNYNNIKKYEITCMERYGVPNVLHLKQNQTNGKRISKFQKREYEKILKVYPDAKLEEYLPDVRKSADIFIPSQNKIVECFGDYWHCNPKKYAPDYYHNYVHMNASEIWHRDAERVKSFQEAGYTVEILWENA